MKILGVSKNKYLAIGLIVLFLVISSVSIAIGLNTNDKSVEENKIENNNNTLNEVQETYTQETINQSVQGESDINEKAQDATRSALTQNTNSSAPTNNNPTTQPQETTPQPVVNVVPKVCDQSLLASWNNLYNSTVVLYETYIDAENSRHTSELSSIAGEMSRRGLLFSGIHESAKQEENSYHQSRLSSINSQKNSELANLQAKYPLYC